MLMHCYMLHWFFFASTVAHRLPTYKVSLLQCMILFYFVLGLPRLCRLLIYKVSLLQCITLLKFHWVCFDCGLPTCFTAHKASTVAHSRTPITHKCTHGKEFRTCNATITIIKSGKTFSTLLAFRPQLNLSRYLTLSSRH
jgi:hypothetical protein